MFADQLRAAIEAAPRITLPQMTALLWRAYGEGPDPIEALPPRFKHQVMAVRGLIRNANVYRAFAAARMAPERLERILDELRKQGQLDSDIDRMTSELVHAIEGLDGAIYGPGSVGEVREAKVGAARATANRKLDELIGRLPPT